MERSPDGKSDGLNNSFATEKSGRIDLFAQYLRDLTEAVQTRSISRIDLIQLNEAEKAVQRTYLAFRSVPSTGLYGNKRKDEQDGAIQISSIDDNASTLAALSLGSRILYGRTLTDCNRLFRQKGIDVESTRYCDIQRVPDVALLEAPLGGVPIIQVLTNEAHSAGELRNAMVVYMEAYKLALAEIMYRDDGLKSLMDGSIFEDEIYAPFVAGVTNNIAARFPITLKMFASDLIGDLVLVVDAESDTRLLEKVSKSHYHGVESKTVQKALNSAKDVVKKVKATRLGLLGLFLNPASLDANENGLLDQIDLYLNDSGIVSDRFLHLCMLDEPENITKIYRLLAQYVSNNPQADTRLFTILDRLYTQASQIDVPVFDDVEVIIGDRANDEAETTEDVFWKSLGNHVRSIKGTVRTTDFDIEDADVDRITQHHFVAPSSIAVHIGNNPAHFTVAFLYSNDQTGEVLDLVFSFDSKNQTIDWNVLEDLPDQMRTAVLAVATKTLAKTEEIARNQKQLRLGRFSQSPSVESPHKKREHYYDPIYGLRKKETSPSVSTSIVERGATTERQSGIRYEIIVTDEDRQRYFAHYSLEIQDALEEGIAQYNSGKRGRFRSIATRRNGDRMWRLRVGQHRILVKQEESSVGNMRFGIVDVCSKKENYPRRIGI